MVNLHGNIFYGLERKAREMLDLNDLNVRDTFACADQIEAGTFVEVMLFLLRTKRGYEADLSDFVAEAQPYLGKSAYEIGDDNVCRLFDLFLGMYASGKE